MIFINNKYTTWYNNIITNAKSRDITEGYTERHHIIPKSLNGNNSKENLVVLTAREHFICHWLLSKMLLGEPRWKMLYALSMMKTGGDHHKRYHTKITARVYKNIKEEVSLIISETNKRVWQNRTQEERDAVIKKAKDGQNDKTPEERIKDSKRRSKIWQDRSQEEKDAIGRKSSATQHNKPLEEKLAFAKKISDIHRNRPAEEKANTAKLRTEMWADKPKTEKEEISKKRSNSMMSRPQAEKEAWANKISKANRGRKHYNNGKVVKMCFPGTEPEGFYLGRKLKSR